MQKTEEKKNLVSNKKYKDDRWKLSVLIDENSVEKFSLDMLEPYPHPETRQTYLPSANGKPLKHFIVDKLEIIFKPEEDPTVYKMIDWLLMHPRVRVEGINEEELKLNNKIKPDFVFVNLDKRDFTEMDKNNVIDEMVGRLSFAAGPYSVGLKKIRYACAMMGIVYKDRRNSKNPETELKHLRNKMKDHIRKSPENAAHFKQILSNAENAARMFALKVLLEEKEIVYEHGVFKYQGKILGANLDNSIGQLQNMPELDAELQDKAKNIMINNGYTM